MAYRSKKLEENMIDFNKGVRYILSGHDICPERGLQSYFNKMLNDIFHNLAKKSIKRSRKNSGPLTENEVLEAINELFPENLKQRLFEKMASNLKKNPLIRKRNLEVNQPQLTCQSNSKEISGFPTQEISDLAAKTVTDFQGHTISKKLPASILNNNAVNNASSIFFSKGNIGDQSGDSAWNVQMHPAGFAISPVRLNRHQLKDDVYVTPMDVDCFDTTDSLKLGTEINQIKDGEAIGFINRNQRGSSSYSPLTEMRCSQGEESGNSSYTTRNINAYKSKMFSVQKATANAETSLHGVSHFNTPEKIDQISEFNDRSKNIPLENQIYEEHQPHFNAYTHPTQVLCPEDEKSITPSKINNKCKFTSEYNQETFVNEISETISIEQPHCISQEISPNITSQPEHEESSCQIDGDNCENQPFVNENDRENNTRIFQRPQVQRCLFKNWFLAPFFPFS